MCCYLHPDDIQAIQQPRKMIVHYRQTMYSGMLQEFLCLGPTLADTLDSEDLSVTFSFWSNFVYHYYWYSLWFTTLQIGGFGIVSFWKRYCDGIELKSDSPLLITKSYNS